MATTGAPQGTASNSRQTNTPSQKPPEKPRGGKSKRTLIESACTACQKRKSRCDGQRPACTRCKTLHTECEYNAEEGESRWSALRRKNRTIERERDEARELIALMHSSSEFEAQELYRHIRASTHSEDVGAIIREIREAVDAEAMSQQQHQHQQQQQQQQQQQYQHQVALSQEGFSPSNTAPAPQLPPLRSVVDVPPTGGGVSQQPLLQSFPPMRSSYRQSSLASAVSSASYSSLSSSDGQDQQSLSLSPREDAPANWPQRFS